MTTYAEWSARAPAVPATPPSQTPATCDSAHDHCLRGAGWFIDSGETLPVVVEDGIILSYSGMSAMHWPDRFFVTVPAVTAPERIVEGRQAIGYFAEGVPASEADAVTSRKWQRRGVDRFDADAGIVVLGGDPLPIEQVRVLVELVEVE